MRWGSVCTGYGGLDMAAVELLGGEPAWFADIDSAASKVLEHHWPGVPNLGDISSVDWSAVEPVDGLTGGTPCQDLSNAGKRAGMRAGTRSGLWHSMCDAIEALRPRLVLWENVRGALSARADSAVERCPGCVGDRDDGPVLRALGRVLGDLAELGYDAVWCGLPAAAVGCAHLRWRVFVAAKPAGPGRGHVEPGDADEHGDEAVRAGQTEPGRRRCPPAADTRRDPRTEDHADRPAAAGRGRATVADASGGVRDGHGGDTIRREGKRTAVARSGEVAAADPTGVGRGERRPEPEGQFGGPDAPECGGVAAAHADIDECAGQRLQQSGEAAAAGRGGRAVIDVDWREYGPAIRQHELMLGRPAPAPTVIGKRGGPKLSPYFTEWLMGLPEGHITGVEGLSVNDMLRLCGNGVVRQQAVAAYRYLLPLLFTEGRWAA